MRLNYCQTILIAICTMGERKQKKWVKLFMFSLFAAIFTTYCSFGGKENDNVIDERIINIDPKSPLHKKITLIDIIDSITYIPLETNDNCLIGPIKWNFIYSENFILLNNTDDKIFLFNKNGKFISQIGNIGQGPGDYLKHSAVLVRIDEENSQVTIKTSHPTRFMFYDFKGKFIKSIDTSHEYAEAFVEYTPNFYFLKYANLGRTPYSYTVLDTTFNLVTRKIRPVHFSLKSDLISLTSGPIFCQYTYNNQIHVRENTLNDTVYLINNDFTFTPRYVIHSGKFNVSVELRSDALRYFKEVRNYVILWSIFETNDFVFILYEYQHKLIPCFFHKTDHKVFRIETNSSGIPNDFDGGLDFWPVYQNNKEIVAFYDASLFVEHKKNTNELKLQGGEESIKRYNQMVRMLKPDDNPVMVIVKLK